MMNADMLQYLDVFLDEGREQLVLLETGFLEMERGEHTPETMQALFRAAHTLKGSSRAMGFLGIGDLTHEMENVMDDLRHDKLTVSTPLVNVLLDCLDALGGLVDAVAETQNDAGPNAEAIPALVARLNALLATPASPAADATPATPAPVAPEIAAPEIALEIAAPPAAVKKKAATSGKKEKVAVSAPVAAAPVQEIVTAGGSFPLAAHEESSLNTALASGLKAYHLALTLDKECLMKSVRVWMALSALEPLGTMLASSPSEDALEEEKFDFDFSLLLVTHAEAADVERALSSVAELASVIVSPWASADALENALVTEDAPAAEEDAPTAEEESSAEEVIVAEAVAEAPAALVAAPVAETAPAAPRATAAERAPAAEKAPTAPASSPTIRVEVARLDTLLNLVGELVIERAQINRIGTEVSLAYPRDENAAHLVEATHRLGRITGELQDQIMKARMLPVDGVFQRMPRMVRDLAQKTGKEIKFEITGGETELDRTVLEVISDPLIHLLRNSVDHGVEPPDVREAAGKTRLGTVTLSARQEENHVVLEVTDDGGGMDPSKLKESAIRKGILTEATAAAMSEQDALHLIFASGFSTAAALSDISGRGVGMDIVKSNLEKLNGRIHVESVVGRGSRFLIHLPLTLAIVRAVLVESSGGFYVLPLGNVVELLRLGSSEGEIGRRTLGGQAVISLRGRTIPLASLAGLLQGRSDATRPESIAEDAFVVIAGTGDRQLGLCVDGLAGEQEVVIKSLGTLLGTLPGLSGATILGDGRVALIVDLPRLIKNHKIEATGSDTHKTEIHKSELHKTESKQLAHVK